MAGCTVLPISPAANVWAPPLASELVQLRCDVQAAGEPTGRSATTRAAAGCASCDSQKRSASCAYWLAWV